MNDEERGKLRQYLKWTDALLRSMEVCLGGEDPKNQWKHGGYKQFARKYNQILDVVAASIDLPPILDKYNLDKMPYLADTIPLQQKDFFESVHANVSLLKSFLESQLGVVEDQITALRDFLQARLRSAIMRPPEKEQDIQDAIEQLLIGRGLVKGQDYDRETGRVKVATKEMIPDFILLKLGLAIEVKLIANQARTRAVIDEINADILGYANVYRQILFVVYDLGFVRVEEEFRKGLEIADRVSVILVKH
jgi:hypothetical protein